MSLDQRHPGSSRPRATVVPWTVTTWALPREKLRFSSGVSRFLLVRFISPPSSCSDARADLLAAHEEKSSHDAVAHGEEGCLGTARGVDLGVDALDVVARRLRGHPQLVGDVLGRQASGGELS